jgi:hypothetical protein
MRYEDFVVVFHDKLYRLRHLALWVDSRRPTLSTGLSRKHAELRIQDLNTLTESGRSQRQVTHAASDFSNAVGQYRLIAN